jgi:hypothetical protein
MANVTKSAERSSAQRAAKVSFGSGFSDATRDVCVTRIVAWRWRNLNQNRRDFYWPDRYFRLLARLPKAHKRKK